jgi:hypothetical protein
MITYIWQNLKQMISISHLINSSLFMMINIYADVFYSRISIL